MSESERDPSPAKSKVVGTIGLPMTDLGNAERLVAKYRDQIRYCTPRKKWLVWDKIRWRWDETGVINRLAKATVRSIYAEAQRAPDELRKELTKHALASESSARIGGLIALAATEAGIPILPHELDSDPWLFNVQNGTIDLRTGELRPHSQSDFITKLSPVEFEPEAKLELWDRFLVDATGDDPDLAAYLQRIAGYCLTGLAHEKKFFFIYGPRDTAKSTFIDALTSTLGSYAESADFSTWLEQTTSGGNRSDLVRLAGSRFVSSVEVKKDKKWDEALIKRVVGGDAITAAAKYELDITFRATFKLVLAANDAPKIRDDDDGMWARVQRIPFVRQLKTKDPAVKATLSDAGKAGPAILAWAVKGCLDWQQSGLGSALAVEQSTAEYRNEMDRLSGFLADCLVFEDWDEVRVSRDALSKAYAAWCEENAVKPVPSKELAARLRKEGATDGKSNGVRVWKRVRLAGPDDEKGQEGQSGTAFPETFLHEDEWENSLGEVSPGVPGVPDDDIEREAIQSEPASKTQQKPRQPEGPEGGES